MSDRSGRDEVWLSDPEGRTPKKITDLDNEKGALVWTPDSKSLLYTAADKKLYSYSVADGKTAVVTSSDVARIGSVSVSPDSKWVAFSKQDRTLRSHVYIAPIAGGEERHVSDDSLLYSENNAVWTADGRYIVFTSTEGVSNGIATQGGINTTMALWALSLRDQERDPMNRDIDNEAQGLAAEAAARQNAGAAVARRCASRVDVRIDWSGLARRARQLTVPGTALGALTPAPEGQSVALTVSTQASAADAAARRGRRRRRASTSSTSRAVSSRACLRRRSAGGSGTRRSRRGGAGGGFGGGGSMVFARDGRTLYFRSGTGCMRASQSRNAPAARRSRRRRRPAADVAAVAAAAAAPAMPRRPARATRRRARSLTPPTSRWITRRCARRCSTRAGGS